MFVSALAQLGSGRCRYVGFVRSKERCVREMFGGRNRESGDATCDFRTSRVLTTCTG